MDQELIDYLDRRFTEIRTEIAASAEDTRRYVDATATEIRQHVDAVAEETRRHFDVVAEQSTDKIKLVAEGVIGVDRKIDRLAGEMRQGFDKVDRRFLHLHAEILRSR